MGQAYLVEKYMKKKKCYIFAILIRGETMPQHVGCNVYGHVNFVREPVYCVRQAQTSRTMSHQYYLPIKQIPISINPNIRDHYNSSKSSCS
jgi:hypothetical protein